MKLDWQLPILLQMVAVSLPQLYTRVEKETSYPDGATGSQEDYDDALDRTELLTLARIIIDDLG